jgi:S1-C subfamily serine protease
LTVGDILLELGDKPVADTVDLQSALDPEEVGKTLNLRVLRAGKVQEIALTVVEREG